jgi:hypothetical protein
MVVRHEHMPSLSLFILLSSLRRLECRFCSPLASEFIDFPETWHEHVVVEAEEEEEWI